MSAQKSGGSAGRLKAKNQAMAAQMKVKGIERTSGRCAICNKEVGLSKLYNHITTCKG